MHKKTQQNFLNIFHFGKHLLNLDKLKLDLLHNYKWFQYSLIFS